MYLVSWDLFLATRVTLDWDFGTLCIVCLTKNGNEVFFKTLQSLGRCFTKLNMKMAYIHLEIHQFYTFLKNFVSELDMKNIKISFKFNTNSLVCSILDWLFCSFEEYFLFFPLLSAYHLWVGSVLHPRQNEKYEWLIQTPCHLLPFYMISKCSQNKRPMGHIAHLRNH